MEHEHCCSHEQEHSCGCSHGHTHEHENKKTLTLFGVTALLLAVGFLPLPTVVKIAVGVCAYLLIGWDILKEAFEGLREGEFLDENFLMAVASLGAIVLAVLERTYDFSEAVAVVLFFRVGEFFEHAAVGKSRRSIETLMDIRPDSANLETPRGIEAVDPATLAVGSVIIVQPGEKVPIDGIVISGESDLDTAALTGESMPRSVTEGDEIMSGCICLTGVLRIRTTKLFAESTVSKILKLVSESSAHKAKSERFISKFSRVYTPAVCIAALAVGILPPLLGLGTWRVWLYRALTFLVISCPCALVISIPLTFFAGIGGASRKGILIKGANFMQTLAQVRTVVFDKTGTLTRGTFRVQEISPCGMDEQRLLEYAALAECASSHPIAKSLLHAYAKPIDRSRVKDITEHGGHGVSAAVDGRQIAVGSKRLMRTLGIDCEDSALGGTCVHVAADGTYAGCIVIADEEKPTASDAVKALKKMGARIVMLTGDNRKSAEVIAAKLSIDEVCSELLPADKVTQVERLQSQTRGTLCFVGDGINDAPVLARADIGIAMGALGSDAAIEAADVVIMDDDVRKVSLAASIGRKTLGIVRQNIVFAIGVKMLCLVLGAVGIANLWMAVFADVGVMVLAVLNAMRALRVK